MKMLIVEDDALLLKVFARSFGRIATTLVASDVRTAREVFQDQQPEVVLTDFRVPEARDGIEFAKWVKQQAPKTLVIMMTGSDVADIPAACRADHKLNKVDEFESRVEQCVAAYKGKHGV